MRGRSSGNVFRVQAVTFVSSCVRTPAAQLLIGPTGISWPSGRHVSDYVRASFRLKFFAVKRFWIWPAVPVSCCADRLGQDITAGLPGLAGQLVGRAETRTVPERSRSLGRMPLPTSRIGKTPRPRSVGGPWSTVREGPAHGHAAGRVRRRVRYVSIRRTVGHDDRLDDLSFAAKRVGASGQSGRVFASSPAGAVSVDAHNLPTGRLSPGPVWRLRTERRKQLLAVLGAQICDGHGEPVEVKTAG
jgi:hypothetical protein